MRTQTQPLDPDTDAGRAAAEALTAFLAWVEPRVAARRRFAALADSKAVRTEDRIVIGGTDCTDVIARIVAADPPPTAT